MFKKLDTNGDGSVDQAELQAAKKDGKGPDPAKMMQALDTNGDGKIDESESEAGIAKMKEKSPADLQNEIKVTTQYTSSGEETNAAQGLLNMKV